MEENRKGFILSAREVTAVKANDKVMVLDEKGQIQTVKCEGDPKLIDLRPLLRPTAKFTKEQPESSMYTTMTLETIYPGGRIDEHFNETTAEMPVCDLALYVICGRIRATIGDMEKVVRGDTLMYLPTNVKRSQTNIGKGLIKFVRISGSAQGKKWGQPVYSKMPTWIGVSKRKLAATKNQLANITNKGEVLEKNRKVFILPVAEVVPAKAPDKVRVLDEKGQIQTVESEGNPKLLQFYPLLRPTPEFTELQPEPSIYTWVTLGKMQPGGCIDEFFNETTAEMPVFDAAVYVISGQMRVTLGGMEKTVGADTLIYCPSNVRRSFSNIGNGLAKFLAINGAAEGAKMGKPVYSKMPTWNLGVGLHKRKLTGN